ncbi:MAG TPA: maleylpyruvate isomerase family mycothiol-dependent enzyme [Jatrophihabitans sp.]
MSSHGPWPVIHRERAALADDLADLPADSWSSPSLCPEWTVHQVLGHLVATAKLNPARFMAKFAGAGFRFDVMTDRAVAYETSATPEQTLQHFRAQANASTAPPGPVDSWLGEIVVHSSDIRLALGIDHRFADADVVRVADFYRKSNALIGAKSRIAGLTLHATDVAWTAGSGPEVTGPILELVMAMTGRSAVLSRLGGSGLGTLGARVGRGVDTST